MDRHLKETYGKLEVTTWTTPNHWDLIALLLIFIVLALITWGALHMSGNYQLGDVITIHLSPRYLPLYALKTTVRLFIGLFLSFICSLIFGTIAAKSHAAERLIIPSVDILQSVPVLSFFSLTATGFIVLFKGKMLGPECAAIFGIFTAQVWNMILSVYQGIKTVPQELKEAASIFQLSPWQRFWRIEVPFSLPNLIWNMMISMSGSWFFVIACEAITVGGVSISLPGIGSYIALAIKEANVPAIWYAIICMLLVILLYDQLFFRPLLSWVDRFKEQVDTENDPPASWLISLFQHTKLWQTTAQVWLLRISEFWLNFKWFNLKVVVAPTPTKSTLRVIFNYFFGFLFLSISAYLISRSIFTQLPWLEVRHVIFLGFLTCLRVMALIAISALVWLPIGVAIGLRPRLTAKIQPLIQFCAAFPSNLLFPIATTIFLKYNLNIEYWSAPLMVLGTQWYLLFNVIVGTSQIATDLKLVAQNFQLSGWLWWRRFILPSIAPSFVTGAITAAGGAWNASIIAEVITWGNHTLIATGIGSYIATNFAVGDFARVMLGTVVMCLFVFLINRLIWQPLFNYTIAHTSDNEQ